ncbi:MAG: sulfatase-like hydrolase/transferase [Verrucomicrobia bacterium]|nr:sulfatase-like hydrolase/transferase [Verrucomicrobiota bacterium]
MRILILLLAAFAIWAQAIAQRPNVVLIMADDLGYHDLGGYGHPKIKTPVLDRLAEHGVKLTAFYAGATVCTPSRIALMTGSYPTRLGWSKGVVGHILSTDHGLNTKATTMAERFRAAGYRTAMSGKWHLGDRPPFRPHRHGFDRTFYINKSNNQTDELWRDDTLLEKPYENRLLTEKFTREAIDFIRANKAKPFFLYLPYSAPHFPVEPHPDWEGKSNFGVYGDVVEEMDARIGDILDTLKTERLDKKTLVIFCSDNGPEPLTKESLAKPFRGKKWSSLEGGTRVPCILSWPGVLPAGRTTDAMISAMDLLPTLAHVCRIDLAKRTPDALPLDGVNVWDTLLGKTTPHARQDLLYWHGSDGFEAIRVGDWKLFPDRRRAKLKGNGPALFHLAKDIEEKTDLSSEHPERVQSMHALANQRLAGIRAKNLPLGQAKVK